MRELFTGLFIPTYYSSRALWILSFGPVIRLMARIVAAALRNQDPDSSLGKALYHLRGKLEEFMKYGRTLGPEGHKAVQKLKQNGFSNSVIAIVGFSRIMTHYGAAWRYCQKWCTASGGIPV